MWLTSDPVSRLGLSLALILMAAKIGGDLAARLRQPAVLGELVMGIGLGCVPVAFFRQLPTDSGLDILARIGVLVLLFEVGLESTVHDVLKVGASSARVAALGIVGTLSCGWLAAWLTMPSASRLVQTFVATAMTATSIGISARVLKDSGASGTPVARTILGASVIDDILGLVALALMGSTVVHASGGSTSFGAVLWLVAKTLAFLAIALAAGVRFSPWLFRSTLRLRTEGALLAVALSFCFVLAWASDVIGLAPIVGAFAAGLILEDSHSTQFVQRGERSLRERMEPISSWLVPIFFVLTGMRADFAALSDPKTLLLVAALTLAAVLGKLACAAGVPRGVDRVAVALGMIPRGEVSLVFANLGVSLRVGGRPLLDPRQYAALVMVVVLTTLATPPALRWRLRRSPDDRPPDPEESANSRASVGQGR
jgi:Kef-type K+ transport system membrane component KefB